MAADMVQEPDKFCPFIQAACREDCMLLRSSEESMIRKCSFAIIAEQLDIMAVKSSRKTM